MIIIKKRILSIVTIIVLLLTFTVINVNATMVTPIPSGIDDSADYLLKVPDEGNYIYYASWKAHGLVWSSFKTFGRHHYDSNQFLFSDSSGYIHTKTINGENYYEAEFNMKSITYDTLDGCNLLAIQPVQIQFDKPRLTNISPPELKLRAERIFRKKFFLLCSELKTETST